jgi:DNA helicase-2/ATP-dependent DNA helicase PcrA
MTLHSAKGLEFPVVFLPGWEEGLFPNQRALDETGIAGLEEERRLGYVGLTRAKERAYVSYAANRRLFGSWASSLPSRFVDELPEEHIEVESDQGVYGSRAGGGFADWAGAALFKAARKSQPPDPARRGGMLIEGTAYQVQPRARPSAPFAHGARVFHQKFGYGTVTAVENDKLEIAFDQAGAKKVMDSFVVPAAQAG